MDSWHAAQCRRMFSVPELESKVNEQILIASNPNMAGSNNDDET